MSRTPRGDVVLDRVSDAAAATDVLNALAAWQDHSSTVPLHPGDVGWLWRLGERTALAALRVWRAAGVPVAVGILDGPDLLRVALAPHARDDVALAERLAGDLESDVAGVLPAGDASIEARLAPALRRVLTERGWTLDEAWTPLRCATDAAASDPLGPGVAVERLGPTASGSLVADRVAAHRAAFPASLLTAGAWHVMAGGPAYAAAHCVVASVDGEPAAAATVWSAGPGRPGLIEPLGVHSEHRGRGLGRAITRAAVRALGDLGSPVALVCTPAANTGGVAAYRSAGFEQLPESRDLRRPAAG